MAGCLCIMDLLGKNFNKEGFFVRSKFLLLLVIIMLLLLLSFAGCGLFSSPYPMEGTWIGVLQDTDVKLEIISENSGSIVFIDTGQSYSLDCKRTSDDDFVATYGWYGEYGWQQREIQARFNNRDELYVRLYNQLGNCIASGAFFRQ